MKYTDFKWWRVGKEGMKPKISVNWLVELLCNLRSSIPTKIGRSPRIVCPTLNILNTFNNQFWIPNVFSNRVEPPEATLCFDQFEPVPLYIWEILDDTVLGCVAACHTACEECGSQLAMKQVFPSMIDQHCRLANRLQCQSVCGSPYRNCHYFARLLMKHHIGNFTFSER